MVARLRPPGAKEQRMRIGIVSHPMLWQRDQAVRARIRAIIGALQGLGQCGGGPLQVALVDADPSHLDSHDVLHVFSAGGGNHRLVEAAADLGLPVVVSPLVSTAWDRRSGRLARHSDHRLGQQTGFSLHSHYAHTRRALQLASLVVALGNSEKAAIETGFLIDPSRVRVLPHGVSAHLFEADGQLFRLRTGIGGPFVLLAGPISPSSDQLGLARQLSGCGLPLVVLGEARERDQDYLRQLRSVPGVTCLGGLYQDARLLASAHAAASVLVLPCRGDSCVHSVFDALASGTPVLASGPIVLPGSEFALKQVDWQDRPAHARALRQLIAAPPPRAAVRALVRPYSWQNAAAELAACYQVLAERGHALAL
jgi:glycosyltransferase involved in cell wall biosynthesis